jgi:hypothetical protein
MQPSSSRFFQQDEKAKHMWGETNQKITVGVVSSGKQLGGMILLKVFVLNRPEFILFTTTCQTLRSYK